jgi:hypothetical protein
MKINKLKSEIEKIRNIMSRLHVGSKVIYKDIRGEKKEGIITNISRCPSQGNNNRYYCSECL